ncbi:response regulator [uncultured Phenylobacterium sp.]|uniref:response regulator n=1 Tax=uncultured Phenylobacterium sp. TaxID=349273 RepID=UPI0025FAC2BC|nr:response regulator [uncultured Phenylobacterium sp.]
MAPEFSGHVLIIEDEPVIALELEILLGDLGFRSFDVADCPQDALACAKAHRPQLITADYRIFSGTGVEAVQLITAEVGEIPVVYVTGNPDMLPDGAASAVVDKPISPTALAAACVRAGKRGQLDG